MGQIGLLQRRASVTLGDSGVYMMSKATPATTSDNCFTRGEAEPPVQSRPGTMPKGNPH